MTETLSLISNYCVFVELNGPTTDLKDQILNKSLCYRGNFTICVNIRMDMDFPSGLYLGQ